MKYVTAFLAGVLMALGGCRSSAPDLGPIAEDDPVQTRTFEAPYGEVYEAALASADVMRWVVTEADQEGQFFAAETPEATPEEDVRKDVYEDDVYVVFEETETGIRVEVMSGVRWQSNVEDAKVFLEGIAERL